MDGLKAEEDWEFMCVYIDDVLAFSRTLEEHLEHIEWVFQWLRLAGLKLRSSKCHFLREEVEYLGARFGLKVSSNHVKAVIRFAVRK